ncbi:uncharacterized protein Dana_GF19949 [Drosophila ananassae]|uniref:Uncharacterized protein n=1 Tax=Drosophila ananassae TaxID=7217 RepID=B3LV92_DROAN|nr:uncharacterized protein Dana_GF19949 [Drosophila ananassae]
MHQQPKIFQGSAPAHLCLRINYIVDEQEGYFHMFRSANLRFFNNVAYVIKTQEELTESMTSIVDMFRIALDNAGNTDVRIVTGGVLQRRKSKVPNLDVPRGMPRNRSESQLVQLSSKALSNNQKSMVYGIDHLFDMSEFRISFNEEVITIGGNLTSIWDLDAFDRVVFTIDPYKLERGTWQPTIFNIKSNNFCNDMYGKNFYWYTYWTQYITNTNAVKHLCLLPGTKLTFQEYKLNVIVDIPNVNLNGVYKLQYTLQAYDLIGRKRPTSLCFEVRGEYTKIRKN